jgi:hypothetical protein
MALQNLRSNTANKRPTASGMVDGQVAINTNATNPGLFFKDAGDGIRKVGPVFIGSSAPNSSPAVGGSTGHSIGEQWLDTSGSRYVVKTWDGTAWRDDDSNYLQLTGGALSGALTINNAANVAALDLKFDGDTDTGFYAPAANTLGFVGGGTERLRIDGNGRVGIGTTSPDALLDVENSSGASEIQIKSLDASDCTLAFGDNADTDVGRIRYAHSADAMLFFTAASERLRIDSSGNVGIGTSSPGVNLEIVSTSVNSIAKLKSSSSTNGGQLQVNGTDFIVRNRDNGNVAFWTNDSERMRIDSSGNVGIGTTSPDALLHLKATSPFIRFTDSADDTHYAHIGYSDSSVWLIDADAGNAKANSAIQFKVDNSERMRIDSSGRVLIGTTSSFASSNADDLQVGDNTASAQSGITLGSTVASSIRWRDGADAGIISYLHSDNSMRFSTADSERLRIDSSGRVLIGTTTEGEASSDDLTIANSGDCGITIRAGTSSKSKIFFSDGTSGVSEYRGYMQYWHNDDALLFGTFSVERMRIDSSGNVGIGTSSPNRKLQVAGATAITNSGDTGAFLFDPAGSVNTLLSRAGQSSTTALPLAVKMGNTQRLHIDSDGRVGVGLTPSSTASITNVNAGLIQTDGNIDIRYPGTSTDPSGSRYLSFVNTDSTLVANQPMGGIRWVGNDTSNPSRDTASILAFCQGNAGTKSHITFNTDGGTERMRIESSGNVGIGTSSPAEKLEVQSSTNTTIRIDNEDDSTATLVFHNTGSTDRQISVNSGSIRFGGSSDEQMRIDSSGNVGIGTTSPSSYGGAVKLAAASAGNTALSIVSGTSSDGTLFFADGTSGDATYRASVKYSHASDAMQFSTAANERMRIDSSGNVGIGDTAPSQKLNVAGNVMLEGSDQFLYFTNVGTGNSGIYVRGRTATSELRSHSTGVFTWEVTGTERMRLDSSGQLGINTSSPSSALHVNGTSRFDNYIHFGGIISTPATSAAIYRPADNQLAFSTANSERMRIDNSGNVGIGTSSPDRLFESKGSTSGEIVAAKFSNGQDDGSSDSVSIAFGLARTGGLTHEAAKIKAIKEQAFTSTPSTIDAALTFETIKDENRAERMRIGSTGLVSMHKSSGTQQLRIGTVDGSTFANYENYTILYGSAANNYVLTRACNTADGTPGFEIVIGGTRRIEIESDGDIFNSNGTYGSISDARLKENIVDASSQWGDIKDLQVRNFNFTVESGLPTNTQIGFVAQEVEQVSPGLVKTNPDEDEDGNDLGTTTKTVKTSVLLIKAVKALQEAMDRIETLEAKVAALEAE